MEGIGFDKESENDDNVIKKFVIEITGKLKNISTVEFADYQDALQLFNEHSKEGKNLILYEVHKSSTDGSVVKKVPILNTSKHAERMRILEEEARLNALSQSRAPNDAPLGSSTSPSSGQKEKITFSNMKYKIFILAAVVGGLIIILFLMNILASGAGNLAGHSILLESIQTYFYPSYIGHDPTGHQALISVYFML